MTSFSGSPLRPEQIFPLEIWDYILRFSTMRVLLNVYSTCRQLYKRRDQGYIRQYRLENWGYLQEDIPKGIWHIGYSKKTEHIHVRENTIINLDETVLVVHNPKCSIDFHDNKVHLKATTGMASYMNMPIFILMTSDSIFTICSGDFGNTSFNNYHTAGQEHPHILTVSQFPTNQ